MKKINTLWLVLLLGLLTAQPFMSVAQKKSAGVAPFTYISGQVNDNVANVAYGEVASAINNSGRFIPVNRDAFKQVVRERELNKNESFIDGKSVSEAKDIGAEILFVGNVIGLTKENDPIIHISAIDVVTNKILASEVVSKSERRPVDMTGNLSEINNRLWYASYNYDTWHTANQIIAAKQIFDIISKSDKSLKTQVDAFLDANFPLKLSIARFEDDGKQIKKALIKGDKTIGLNKGDSVEFVEEKTVKERDGSEGVLRETIAKGKVEDFSGDYIVVKVTDKGKDLYAQKENLKIFVTRKK
jgi:hypothetical protein